ncbi:kinase domain protein [Chaetomium strumarium]|uniref:non-specific serine/threonine protein kinase n=1 Tax=Chaetomium strumarium TaxID=1170767 RepID=A0AAJ0GL06_9PEZI|nr:kinase domain protein [Chaetomium strumarium]
MFDVFKAGNYCPVNIGDLFSSKYQVVGKLGFGSTSTVWLARNLQEHDFTCRDEFHTYQAIDKADPLHSGHRHVRTALEIPDIKADNMLHAIVDEGILQALFEEELRTPSARKYDFGRIILSDFGAAVRGDVKRNHGAQPNVYRSPEVMLGAPWSYPADIWNVRAMIWDVFEDGHLFHCQDPNGQGYTTRAHLAEVRGVRSREFFSGDGQWIADKAERVLRGRNKAMFLDFVRGMLTWRPEDRKTARELLDDPWLNTWEIPE